MSSPLVSVIIPAFNVEKWIAEAIDSVLHQSFRDLEVIVADDGSTDRTGEIVEKFKVRDVVVLRRSANVGKPLTVAEAFPMVQGRYTTIHDADDFSFPNRFERQVEVLERDRDLALCGTGHVWVDLRGRP